MLVSKTHYSVLATGLASLVFAADSFRDPAPPGVQQLEATQAPAAKPNPDVRFHSKPKPLLAGAVTHDWKSFLGPTHDGVSTETKLLHDWPAGGPKLVWE